MSIFRKLIQHNWVAIIYLNFRMLPLRQALRLPLDVYHKCRFDSLSGNIVLDTPKLKRGMVKIGSQGSDMFERKGCILAIEGDLVLKGSCVFGCSNTIKVRRGATVVIGEGAIFGANNVLYSETRVEIGKGFLSSWNCQIMDSDTHTLTDMTNGEMSPKSKAVRVGNHVWCGNNVKMNKGVVLPDYSVVASCSLVNKDFSSEPQYCVFAGIPAKVIKRNMRWTL